jgi:hypothetical protein
MELIDAGQTSPSQFFSRRQLVQFYLLFSSTLTLILSSALTGIKPRVAPGLNRAELRTLTTTATFQSARFFIQNRHNAETYFFERLQLTIRYS